MYLNNFKIVEYHIRFDADYTYFLFVLIVFNQFVSLNSPCFWFLRFLPCETFQFQISHVCASIRVCLKIRSPIPLADQRSFALDKLPLLGHLDFQTLPDIILLVISHYIFLHKTSPDYQPDYQPFIMDITDVIFISHVFFINYDISDIK